MRSIQRVLFLSFLLAAVGAAFAAEPAATHQPKVFVLGVNGAEWDIIKPLLVRGEMPNLQRVIDNGVSGKLRTVSAPNCPKVYSTIFTSVSPQENGITGFVIGGQTARTDMLKAEPFWSILSKKGVTVGMANVPATFPAVPVNGYLITGMLTRGKNCEDGVLCSPKLTDVTGGDPVYPMSMREELLTKVGNFNIDCSRMPSEKELQGREAEVVEAWLKEVDDVRAQQMKLFDYLLTNHKKDFMFFVQSCEDRVGHWLYPIQPHNANYNERVHKLRVDAFPNQYRALDKVIGRILEFLPPETTFIIISDHGIKPLREVEPHDAHKDHAGTTPVIAKHDFEDGDDVPGLIVAMGPGIKKGHKLMSFDASVMDVAPTLLHLYGIKPPATMKGRVLTELFDDAKMASAK
jgi:predicted AlkP superfamily phosphohydrolase/phosphomutase